MTILKDTGSAGFSFPPSFSSVTSYNADSLLLPWNSVGISPYLFPLDALKCPGDGSGRESSFFLIEYSCLTMLHSFLLYNEMNQLCVCVCVCECVCGFSHSVVSDSAIPRTVAHQAPLSMRFSWHKCWSGLPFPLPGDLPDPGIEPRCPASPALQVDSSPCTLMCSICFYLSDLLHSV